MDYIAIFCAGILVAAVTRFAMVHFHRGYFRQGPIADCAVHVKIIDHLRKQRQTRQRTRVIEQYLMRDGPMSYAIAFHHLAALLPGRLIRKVPQLPNLILFSLTSALFFCYAHYAGTSLVGYDGFAFMVIAAFIFLVSVSNTVFFVTGLAYIGLTPRLLARTSAAGCILFTWGAVSHGDTMSLLLAIAAGAIAWLASNFARQAVLFILALYSVMAWSVVPALIAVGSFVVALALSRRYFLRSLAAQVRHLAAYTARLKQSSYQRTALSRWLNVRALWKQRVSLPDFIGRCIWAEPLRTPLFLPELAVLAVILVGGAQHGHESTWLIPVAAAFIVYLATTTSFLNHLGEAHRYLEYGLFFIAPVALADMLLSIATGAAVPILVALAGYTAAVAAGHILAMRLFIKFPKEDGLAAFLADLRLTAEDVVFPIDMRLGANIAARCPCKTFWWQPGTVTNRVLDEFVQDYPFLKSDFRPLVEKYGVTHIICDKRMLPLAETPYDLTGLAVLKENEKYVAYRP